MPDGNLEWTQIIVALVIYQTATLLVQAAWKKLAGNEYITRTECTTCKKAEAGSLEELKADTAIMRGILLVVAVKVGVDEKEWKKLAQ